VPRSCRGLPARERDRRMDLGPTCRRVMGRAGPAFRNRTSSDPSAPPRQGNCGLFFESWLDGVRRRMTTNWASNTHAVRPVRLCCSRHTTPVDADLLPPWRWRPERKGRPNRFTSTQRARCPSCRPKGRVAMAPDRCPPIRLPRRRYHEDPHCWVCMSRPVSVAVPQTDQLPRGRT